ncbi:type ISP restriction/modification enzyme [Bremerella sp. JC770]|uniref:type ISP restriction/modification enzyme n=1 Tax=Bremerella sp. JC770 TaxID=3232137 RepID=UPI00345AB9D5
MSVGPSAYRIEAELAKNSPQQRRDRGVFYTPWEVARRVVSQVDARLKQSFQLPNGLADTSTWESLFQRRDFEMPAEVDPRQPFVRILEPAAGSGIFLLAVLQQIHQNITTATRNTKTANRQWHKYVAEDLPGRLHAVEIMPNAIEHLHGLVRQFLEDHGVPEKDLSPVSVLCGNTLEADVHTRMGSPATVIVGNPPYSAASTNTSAWIKQLLRGKTPENTKLRSYFEVDGQPLQEKKLWLHDDYVKFLRVAQWHLERARYGVIGLVINHGFLDNVTFRGLRFQLIDQFDEIELLDLNGNSKKRGANSRLARDESVFDIGQGVAISLFSATPAARKKQSVRYGERWGPRETKLKELAEVTWDELVDQDLSPSPPHYFLAPRTFHASREYTQGVLVTELFPQATSTIVTARDALVVDTSRKRLLARISELRDPTVSDEQLRAKYFPRPRSSLYLPGDTRGWKLPAARETLRKDEQWQDRVEPCAYRPFDTRWIYWSSSMIDWPRGEVMNAMRQTDALGLVVRRQMPPDRPCNYFFVADQLAVDGLLRSDNRGNETLLPLTVAGHENLHRDLLPRHLTNVSARSVMAFVYALFHSSEYRELFADHLRIDFPRVFFPGESDLFQQLSQLGEQLISLHLSRGEVETNVFSESTTPIASGHPKHRDDLVWIDRNTPLAEADADTWQFHIGSHQVLRKWLKDRRGAILTQEEIAHYLHIIHAVQQTKNLVQRIDDCIKKLGGFHRAFGISKLK